MITNPYTYNIISVAFDGTLCNGMWPGIGAPNKKVIDTIKRYQINGRKIILNTHRQGLQLEQALEWCRNQGLVFDYVNDNAKEIIDLYGYNPRKIYADSYIDFRVRNDLSDDVVKEYKKKIIQDLT